MSDVFKFTPRQVTHGWSYVVIGFNRPAFLEFTCNSITKMLKAKYELNPLAITQQTIDNIIRPEMQTFINDPNFTKEI
jgi:hypothetical protein